MSRRSRRGRRRSADSAPVDSPDLAGALIVPAATASTGTSYGGNGQGYDAVSATTMRGYVFWPQLDTRKEITSYTRTEILRRARALAENVGLATHILEGLADLTGYLTPRALTNDPEWNELANINFLENQSIPEIFDASGKFGFNEYQLHLDVAAFRDGDILPVLTETTTGRARLATYEAHQIGNPYGVPSTDDSWRDGVRIDRFNKHLAYSLIDPADRTRVSTIRANDAIYYGHFRKIGHVRPVSILRHAINNLIDMGEIVRDVKYGIKIRNQIPLALETAVGGSSFGTSATQAIVGNIKRKTVAGTDAAGNASDSEIQYEDVMTGGNVWRGGVGQTLKPLIDAAPHPNQLALLAHMIRDISWGCGVAPEILWDINSLRGANNRLLNSKLQRWIGARLLRKRNFVRRYWVYAIAKELKAGRLPECRDPQWWKVGMLPQGSITADRGREGKLDIELVANRLMSLQEFFAKEGKDWLSEVRQMADEDAQLSKLGLAVADVARRAVAPREPENTADDEPDADDPAADPDATAARL